MHLTRREFLDLAWLITTVWGALSNFVKYRLLGLPVPLQEGSVVSREPERWAPSACQLCPAGCGVVARIIDGRVVKVEGLPAHPINQGSLCPRGFAGVTELYHPDRLLQPLRRVGARGSGAFEPIGWDEAMRLVVDRLQQHGSGSRFAWLMGQPSGMSQQLVGRFLAVLGSSHLYSMRWPLGELPIDAFRLMVDEAGEPLYDLSQANFVLSFSHDWLQAFPSPVEASRAYGMLRRGRADRRVRIVHMEPRLSMTAAKSDEWIPIQPEHVADVALALAHVIIRERLFDERFVREAAGDFEAFTQLVKSRGNPDAVSQRTGISPDTLRRLAKEFGLKRGLALGPRTDLLAQWAVMALNGLVGNLDARGGVLRRWQPRGLSHALPSERPATSPPTSRQPGPGADDWADGIVSRLASIDTLVISDANPCFASPAPARWSDALGRVPFVVVLTSFLDETALHADVVLPMATALERWHFTPVIATDGTVVANISQPALPPRGQTKPLEDIILQLAGMLGSPAADVVPWTSMEEMVREHVRGLYDAREGTLLPQVTLPGRLSPEEEEPPVDFDEFWDMILARGGLVWPAEAAPWPAFQTPSGRFEFFPKQIAALLRAHEASSSVDQPDAAAKGYPLKLYLYTPLAFLNGSGAHLPHLQQIAGSQLHEAWETWAEIHPTTARQYGLQDGRGIWLASSSGRIRVRARWYEGVTPGVVGVPIGLGHTALGRWAQGIGSNPLELLADGSEARTQGTAWQGTRVKAWQA